MSAYRDSYCRCYQCSRVAFPPRLWPMCLWARLARKHHYLERDV